MTILNKAAGSNLGKRSTRTPTTRNLDSKLAKKREKKQVKGQQQLIVRNPFKDINALPITNRQAVSDAIIMSSSSSSSTTTVSTEAPRGCLRFCLSNHHSSSSSKTPFNRSKSFAKTPKSAPNIRRPSKSKFVNDNEAKPSLLQNAEKTTAKFAQKLKKNPPYLYPWQSGRKVSDTSCKLKKPEPATCGTMSELSLVSELRQEQQQSIADHVNSAGGTSKFRWGFNKNVDDTVNITPRAADKILKSGERRNTSRSPTPPIQASISPEIQCGSSPPSAMPKTPACYAAGHPFLGVSDKRKCRSRGVLAVEDNKPAGFNRPNMREDCDNGDSQLVLHERRDSVAPIPAEASMHWLLSPRNEEMDGSPEDVSRNGSTLCPDTASPKPFICSSSSSHGFSSELGGKSSSTTTSDTTIVTHDSRNNFFCFAPGPTTESQGLFGPSFDHLVLNRSSVSSNSTSRCKVAISPQGRKHGYNLSEENTPYSSSSYRNEQVMQAPLTNLSTDELVIMSPLNGDDMSKLQIVHEADSVTELLRRVHLSPEIPISTAELHSIEVNDSISPEKSIDLTQFHKALDGHASWASDSTTQNITGSDVKISWREGIISQIFEMDDLDCCRCISDEEEDVNGSKVHHFKSCVNSECLVEADKT